MKTTLAILLVVRALVQLQCCAQDSYLNCADEIEVHQPDWMRFLSDSLKLSELSIPGTHDTMARFGGDAFQAQTLDLDVQLSAGIRALDIRCRHFQDRFPIHHGAQYQHNYFEDVLAKANAFLDQHPAETILMRVKEEYNAAENTRPFAATFKWYLAQSYARRVWIPPVTFRAGDIPTLGQVRGRIVILQDFDAEISGILWGTLNVQDEYKVATEFNIPQKWDKVRQQFESAQCGNNAEMFVNFLSGAEGAAPYTVAGGQVCIFGSCGGGCITDITGVNEYALNYLPLRAFDRLRTGLVMMDFPGHALINAIIVSNPIVYAVPNAPGLSVPNAVATVHRALQACPSRPQLRVILVAGNYQGGIVIRDPMDLLAPSGPARIGTP